MNVISFFDGMSCGQLALKSAGMHYDKYFASEIDKHAIKVTQHTFPDTIQLGDISRLHWVDDHFEIHHDTHIEVHPWRGKIDLVLGGSPCQGFSKAGKGLNFDDPRSKLFFEYVRVYRQIKESNPDVKFLLENVDMLKEWENIISKYMGIPAIEINSTRVSAQNRVRLYWTNIGTKKDMFGNDVPGIEQPADRHLVINDILQDEVDEKYYLSEKAMKRIKNFHVTDRGLRPHKGDEKSTGMSEFGTIVHSDQKADALTASHSPKIIVHNGMPRTGGKKRGGIGPLSRTDGKAYCISTDPKSNQIEFVPGHLRNGKFVERTDGKSLNLDANYHKGPDQHGARTMIKVNSLYENDSRAGRVYATNGKAPALIGEAGGAGAQTGLYEVRSRIRRLTPIECERLQGVPDNYTSVVSDYQRYKMLGNGWQIDTIVHILSYWK